MSGEIVEVRQGGGGVARYCCRGLWEERERETCTSRSGKESRVTQRVIQAGCPTLWEAASDAILR